MAHNSNFPANDSFLADFPAGLREEIRAIVDDAVVNALKLQGLTAGNGQGQIPVSNGVQCTGLNAERVGGSLPSAFAPANYMPSAVTGSSNGVMINTDKTKLDGVAAGAEVNQMAFSNVLVNGTTIQADSKTDTLEMVAGTNITLIPDAVNDRLTIAITGKVPSASVADAATTSGTCTGNAATAGTANIANIANTVNNSGNAMTFNWSGQSGQPSWLWGGNEAGKMYVYNPSNFNVNYATTAGSAPANGGTSTYSNRLMSINEPSSYKLGYSASGARTNAGEWGRIVMVYDGNGQTYGVRCDKADYADSAGNANTVGGLTVDQIKAQSSTRVWVSPDFTPSPAKYYEIQHGISGIDINIARAELYLKCTIANNGYAVGDIVSQPTLYYSSGFGAMPSTILTATTVAMIPTSSTTYIYIRNKNTGGNAAPSFAIGWVMFFKIWY